MTDQTNSPLRTAAEAQLAATLETTPERTPKRLVGDLLHELQVHQIELEMQNEALRQTQTALEESRDRYLDLYEFAPVGYLTLSAEGIIEEINLTGVKLLGRERKALLQHRFAACVAPAARDVWQRQFQSVMRHGEPHSVELALQRGDGSVFQAQLEYAPQKGGPGGMKCPEAGTALRVALSNISERKQSEEELRKSEERFAAIARVSADWIWEVDADGVYTFVSEGVISHLGLVPLEVVGRTPFDLMPPDEAARVGAEFAAITSRRETFRDLDNIMLHKDGSLRHLQTSGVPIIDADGALLGYRGLDRDVTERKLGERLLQHSLSRWSLAADSAGIGVWELDPASNTLEWDHWMFRLYGIDPENFGGVYL